MPKHQPIRRQAINRVSWLACTEIQKDMLIKLQNQRPRRWVRDWVGRRGGLGASNTLLRELAEEDPAEYRNALRMDTSKFEELLSMVASKVQKQDTVMRPAISSKTKLEVTLRYLATGDSVRSLGLMFRVPHNTISSFLPDVLAAIYDSLYTFIKVCVARIILIDIFVQIGRNSFTNVKIRKKRFIQQRNHNTNTTKCRNTGQS